MRIRAHRLAISAYLLLLAAAILVLGIFLPGGGLQTGFADLLPADAQMDAAWQIADTAQERELNRQIVALVGSTDTSAQNAFAYSEQLAGNWRQSGIFLQIDSRHMPDLAALRSELHSLGTALLPPEVVRQLFDDPAAYFRARGEDAFNPFSAALLPLDEDWPGFSRFLRAPPGKLQWQAEHGMLFAEHANKTWVFLRAQLPENHDAHALLDLIAASRQQTHAAGLQLLVGGGALFAAESRQQAERESTIMSAVGISLTLALLFAIFRSARILILLAPLAAGIVCGLAATLAVFGHMHILTLVIGTSLIGVLVDFPLHWLTPAIFERNWQPAAAMRRIRPVFLISLVITALGYALLWFTPLPVLKQSAVFSIVALLAAYATTTLLPPFFHHYHPREARLPRALLVLPRLPRSTLITALAFLVFGNLHGNWRDDIRDWIHISPARMQETQAIGNITGLAGSGQYMLITGANNDELLHHCASAMQAAETLIASGQLDAAQSLSQWLLPAGEQQSLQQQLAILADKPEILAASGLPVDAISKALRTQAAREPVSLETSLATHLGEAWRPLYLGMIDSSHLAIVRLYGLRDSAALASAIADTAPPGTIRLMDKRQHLNTLFASTRNQAAWLKLASWAGAWLMLAYLFGSKRGSTILALPLLSALVTLGAFGWMGMPVSLFAMFGLLLAAAIGVDYVIYMLNAVDDPEAKLASITLAALTTAISFVLLATSQTPAVASFGLAVSAGVFCNWLLAAVFLPTLSTPLSRHEQR